jgi:hypothetical protein
MAVRIAACCIWTIAATSDVSAQVRFELVSADAIPATKGITVYTIRDNRIAACYSLFVIDSPVAPPSLPIEEATPPPPAAPLEQARVAQALKDATAIRDRQVGELQQRPLMWSINYGAERERIQAEYERAVRQVLPGLYPSAQIAPGWPTSTPEELNAAVRQAIADADAARNATARSATEARIETLLQRATASSRATVRGPVACVQ